MISKIGVVEAEKYSNPQLQALCFHKKRKTDDAMPTRKEDLINRYKDTFGRPDLSLEEYLQSERGFDEATISEFIASKEEATGSNKDVPMSECDGDDSMDVDDDNEEDTDSFEL